jgi:hypothetical protein
MQTESLWVGSATSVRADPHRELLQPSGLALWLRLADCQRPGLPRHCVGTDVTAAAAADESWAEPQACLEPGLSGANRQNDAEDYENDDHAGE